MKRARTYTMNDLEAKSGFDKRTIAYYISYGVLPKVGRRGPKTTYPEDFLHRLLVIRRIRDLQETGQMVTSTLRRIGQVLAPLTPEALRELAQGDEQRLLDVFAASARPQSAVREVALEAKGGRAMLPARRRKMAMMKRPDALAAGRGGQVTFGHPPGMTRADVDDDPQSAEDVERELTRLLQEVDLSARSNDDDLDIPSGESLLRVPITDDVWFSVRNISKEDAGLVERLAALLRRLTNKNKK